MTNADALKLEDLDFAFIAPIEHRNGTSMARCGSFSRKRGTPTPPV